MPIIYIKNMVCDRCNMVVKSIFSELSIDIENIALGEITIAQPLTSEQMTQLSDRLEKVGFELIDNRRSRTIEQIKKCIIELVHHSNINLKVNLSDYLASEINTEYSSLSSLFSDVEGITIEKYYIAQKVERAKELLVYDDLTLGEIAHQLHYSSIAHLSSQFKKVTGLTPTYYKKLADKRRKPLDKV